MNAPRETPLPDALQVDDTTYFIGPVLRQLDREIAEVYGFAEPQRNTRRMVEQLFREIVVLRADVAALQARVEAAERDAARWKHTADEQSANVTFLREKERQANALLEQEMNDIDRLIVGLGLLVEEGRTEGGFLNVPRIITKVSEMRVDAAIAERISAAIAKEQPR